MICLLVSLIYIKLFITVFNVLTATHMELLCSCCAMVKMSFIVHCAIKMFDKAFYKHTTSDDHKIQNTGAGITYKNQCCQIQITYTYVQYIKKMFSYVDHWKIILTFAVAINLCS